MRLCFGTLARILRVCRKTVVTDRQLVSAMTKTIDPDCKYADGKNGQAVSRLLNCRGEFSKTEISDEAGISAKGERDETNSKVALLAPDVATADLVPKFIDTVLPLLDEDKKKPAVIALLEIITADQTLVGANKSKFEKCLGASKEQLCNEACIVLSEFLAGLFLYTAVLVENRFDDRFVDTIDNEVVPSKKPKQYNFTEAFAKAIVEKTSNITVVDEREPEPVHGDNDWSAECGDEICPEILDYISPSGVTNKFISIKGQQNIKSNVTNNFF